MKSASDPPPSSRVKSGYFPFNQIEKYFLNAAEESVSQRISDRTFQDLDLEDIFKYIDRTVSAVGQQYLYYSMRTIPSGLERGRKQAQLISLLQKDEARRNAVSAEIARLNQKDAYFIAALFQEKYMPRPKWFWLIQILSAASILTVAGALFFPQLVVLLIILLPVNMGIHYWNKNNLYRYGSSLPQLALLVKVAGKLIQNAGFEEIYPNVRKSIKALNQLGFSMSVFRIEAKLQSEIGQLVDYLIELIKALFLIEPVLLFATLKKLDSRRDDIINVFHLIAETDAALSVMHLRESIPCYCEPEFTPDQKQMNISEVYHPLIFNGVANSVHLNQKSALLTGSNMSGKTTFIRTIGISAILGQTIFTCFAKHFSMPFTHVHSAIRISDDLLGDKSYYFEEVTTVKTLLEQSRSEVFNLFLLDELFKGTNSAERIAVGKAVLEYLAQGTNLVLVSTHDIALADLLADRFDLYHFTEVIDNNDIHFDYRIKPGKMTATNAIRILELNKYPGTVVDEAYKIAAQMKGIHI